MNLQERIVYLFELFGKRNAMYMRGDQRVLFLADAVKKFGKLIRNGEQGNSLNLCHSLASVFARTCALADSFIDLPIVESMCKKYPKGGCAYCQRGQCVCDQKRESDVIHATISIDQMMWTIYDWCRHMDDVYGEKNRERGVHFALSRLNEEIGEVNSAQLVDTRNRSLSLSDVRSNLSQEFADVFVWIFSLAVLLEIDLEKALNERYPHLHGRCGSRPCNCGPFFLHLSDGVARDVNAESVAG